MYRENEMTVKKKDFIKISTFERKLGKQHQLLSLLKKKKKLVPILEK